MAKEYKLTQERLRALETELNYLKTTREKEVAELIKEARSFGDLSENSEYDEAKNEQAKLYGRIAEIETILANAVVIDEAEDTGAAGLGSTVQVRELDTDEISSYQLVGSQEANPMQARISDDSPFGRAIIGHVVGDVIHVEAPTGVISYEILSIQK